MTDAERDDLREIVKNFSLEEQGILVSEVDDAVIVEELRERLTTRKIKLDIIGSTAKGDYIYGQ